MSRVPAVLLLTIAALSAGCAPEPGVDLSGTTGPTPTPVSNPCVSGTWWSSGNNGSSRMHPGMDCIGCHDSGDGPTFVVAGTVYGAWGQSDDCNGAQGLTVEITDANGVVYPLTSNSAGNFYLKASDAPAFLMPFTARVTDGTKVNAMAASQMTGACNSCHTSSGTAGAPGRVVTP